MRKIQIALFVLLTFAAPAVLMAGYVWTADGSGAYSGTAAPWVSDAAVTGKLVNSGTENTFTADINVTGAENFTIAGPGVVVTTEKITRVEQGDKTTTFAIQDGATFKTTNVISISDATGQSIGYINVDGGTIESSSEIRVGFHHHGYLNVTNGGVVTTTGNLTVGGLDTRKGIGHVTVGGADSDTNTGSIKAANINVGMSSPATTEMTVNNGTVSAVTFTLGANTANSDGQVHDVKLDINKKGTVTVANGFIVAAHAQKNAIINIDGGTLSTKTMTLGSVGTAALTLSNSGTINASENIVIGNAGTGTLNLQSGTVKVGVVNADSSFTPKSLYLGFGDTGKGTLNITGGSLTCSELKVGNPGTGVLTVNGDAATTSVTAGNMNVATAVEGETSTATITSGTVNLSGALTIAQNGSLLLNGADAKLTTAGNVNVSCNPGSSLLTVSAGSLSGNKLNVNSYGVFTVDGANANVSMNSIGIESGVAQATVNISAGTVTAPGGTTVGFYGKLNVSGGSLSSTCKVTNSGELDISAGTLTGTCSVDNNGKIKVSGGTLDGACTVGSNGTLNLSKGTITGACTVNGNNGTVNLSGGKIIGKVTIGPGTVNVKDSTVSAPAVIEGETVINPTGTMNVNSPLDFTANKSLTLNGTLDIGAGGKFTASSTNGQVFRAGQGTATPTLNIHDGGVLEIGGNTRFLMGDAATSIVTINVDGEGSLLKYAATADCALGFHGTGKTTVSNGGEISTVNLQVGVNNNNNEGVVPSELTIVGAGSAVNATGTVSIGYPNQKGILNMNATNDGFGKITAGTFTRYTQKESEINLGIDHGVLMTENYPAAGYEIVKATTVNNWAVNNASVWETTVSGGTVTATLAENKKAGELENGTVEVTDDLKIAGWVDYTIPEGWNITMSFSGVTGDDEMENLANWINEGSGEMNFTPVGNTLNLFDVPAMSGIMAWDFSGFNALYGANVALESASAYIPEPSTFVLLILGVFALLRGRRFQRR